jgi:hypothetical protein
MKPPLERRHGPREFLPPDAAGELKSIELIGLLMRGGAQTFGVLFVTQG